MDISYFAKWGDVYLMHFSAWVAFIIAAAVQRKGVPKTNKIPALLLSAVILALVGAIFSSHAHSHYLSHFANK